MIIDINPDWRLRSDPLQWILERRKKPASAGSRAKHCRRRAQVAYCPNLAVAFDAMLQRSIFAIEGQYPVQALDPLTLVISQIQQEFHSVIELMKRLDLAARQVSIEHDHRTEQGYHS